MGPAPDTDLIDGNINVPVILIAEKTAHLIGGRKPLARLIRDAPVRMRR